MMSFPLRPIRDDSELNLAISALNELLDLDTHSQDQSDYMEVLGLIIEDYEHSNHPMPEISGRDLLKHLIVENAKPRKEVAKAIGIAPSTLSDILNGRREISRRTRKALAEHYRLAETAFI